MAKVRVHLTRFELELMEVLWNLEKASIREIHELLPESKRLAYTTVQTIVNRLEEKGAVGRVRKIGNAHIYAPLVTRQAARHRLIDDFLGLFGDSAQHLTAHLLETGKLSLADIRELERAHAGSPPSNSAPGRTRGTAKRPATRARTKR